jgi:large subunit ribosomal protein L19e
MNLAKKKALAAKVLGVGKHRVKFNSENLGDIKEAITKQDMRDLYSEGIITLKPIKGRRRLEKRKTRRGPGKIRITVNHRKQIYVKLTRKLRMYIQELKRLKTINPELYRELRKKIRMRTFKSKYHLKEYLESNKKASAPEKLAKHVKKDSIKSAPKKTKKTTKTEDKQ